MEWMLILGITPALAWASWQDLRHRSISSNQVLEIAIVGLAYKLIFAPETIYGSLILGSFGLLLGLLMNDTKSWAEGDTWIAGALGLAAMPYDYIGYMIITFGICIIYTVVVQLVYKQRKVKHTTIAGVPMLALAWIVYTLTGS